MDEKGLRLAICYLSSFFAWMWYCEARLTRARVRERERMYVCVCGWLAPFHSTHSPIYMFSVLCSREQYRIGRISIQNVSCHLHWNILSPHTLQFVYSFHFWRPFLDLLSKSVLICFYALKHFGVMVVVVSHSNLMLLYFSVIHLFSWMLKLMPLSWNWQLNAFFIEQKT